MGPLRLPSASLTVRGFSCEPAQVERLIGRLAESTGSSGVPTAPGRSPLKRSFVRYQVDLPRGTRIDQLIPALLSYTGGIEPLLKMVTDVRPEFLEVDLALPVKDSPEQEGGFIDKESISLLNKLGATLSLGFLSYRDEA